MHSLIQFTMFRQLRHGSREWFHTPLERDFTENIILCCVSLGQFDITACEIRHRSQRQPGRRQ
jgi:hypothetical protein